MKDPIIIIGVPRSRTSLSAAIFKFCGMQTGKLCGKTLNNRKGQFENVEIIKKIQKPYLQSIGCDPMGQYPLPDTLNIPIDKSRRKKVLKIIKNQNINVDKFWGFKDCKAALDFPCWVNAFPGSVWVIVHRKKEDIAKSCKLTSFMRKRKDWLAYVDEYKNRFKLLKKYHKLVYEINTDDIIKYDLNHLKKVIKAIGLNWNEKKVINFIDPKETRLK